MQRPEKTVLKKLFLFFDQSSGFKAEFIDKKRNNPLMK